MTGIDPWSVPDHPPSERIPDPRQVAYWLTRHVVSYTDTNTPVYGGVAMTDTHQRVIAWSIGAEVEVVCDA